MTNQKPLYELVFRVTTLDPQQTKADILSAAPSAAVTALHAMTGMETIFLVVLPIAANVAGIASALRSFLTSKPNVVVTHVYVQDANGKEILSAKTPTEEELADLLNRSKDIGQ